jgi:hypothetical protein
VCCEGGEQQRRSGGKRSEAATSLRRAGGATLVRLRCQARDGARCETHRREASPRRKRTPCGGRPVRPRREQAAHAAAERRGAAAPAALRLRTRALSLVNTQ